MKGRRKARVASRVNGHAGRLACARHLAPPPRATSAAPSLMLSFRSHSCDDASRGRHACAPARPRPADQGFFQGCAPVAYVQLFALAEFCCVGRPVDVQPHAHAPHTHTHAHRIGQRRQVPAKRAGPAACMARCACAATACCGCGVGNRAAHGPRRMQHMASRPVGCAVGGAAPAEDALCLEAFCPQIFYCFVHQARDALQTRERGARKRRESACGVGWGKSERATAWAAAARVNIR